MSRRRKPQVPSSREVRMVCTDRGQHATYEIAVMVDRRQEPPGRVTLVQTGRPARDIRYQPTSVRVSAGDGGPFTVDRAQVGERRPDGGVTWTFRCPSCGRAPQFRGETLARLFDGLYELDPAARRHQVDIGDLPC